MSKVLVIDNYDSFVYNLVESLENLGVETQVVRNSISLEKLKPLLTQVDAVLISPGPGRPEQAGITVPLIQYLKGKKPIIGICLGHQALAYALGGAVDRALIPCHGKRSSLTVSQHPLFKDTDLPLLVGRYHSLIVSEAPQSFEVIAHCEDQIQAMYSAQYKFLGLQFHPESILSRDGETLLKNALNLLEENHAY